MKILTFFLITISYTAFGQSTWSEIVLGSDYDYIIKFKPTGYTSFDVFDNSPKISSGNVVGKMSIEFKEGELQLYTKAASQQKRIKRDIISSQRQQSYFRRFIIDTSKNEKMITATILLVSKENVFENQYINHHIYHLYEYNGKKHYQYYNSMDGTNYYGIFEVTKIKHVTKK